MALAPMTPMMGGHNGTLLWLLFGYAIGALVVSAIFCVAYNMVARRMGGIETELGAEQTGYVREMQDLRAQAAN